MVSGIHWGPWNVSPADKAGWLLYCLWECKMVQPLWNSLAVTQKVTTLH